MIDNQSEHLINESLDGVLPATSQAQLDDVLTKNAEARSYYEDLKRIQAAIEQAAKEEDVPPEIKSVVLQAISEMHPGWQESEPVSQRNWFRDFFFVFHQRPALAGGLVFAVGFALGIATLSAVHPGASGDPHALPGLMAPAAMNQSSLLARETISLPGLSGFMESRLANQDVFVHIDLRSESRVEVTMGSEGDLLRPRGFQLAEPALGDVTLGPNELRISHQGANTYLFIFRKPERKLDLLVRFRAGGEILEKRLPTSER